MSIEHVPGTALTYHLIGFDAVGGELAVGPDGLASGRVAAALAGGAATDVFVFAHGWLGDLPAASRRYGAWVAAMGRSRADVELLGRHRPGFRPLFVGLHWPSRPWDDDEELSSPGAGRRPSGSRLAPTLARAYADAQERAHRLGEGSGRRLLADLQRAARPGTGFHLLGHGFGCIAVSAMLAGGAGEVAPVGSLTLVQGTLSAFAYCADDPAAPGRPGRYHRAVEPAGVTGPVVVTRSAHDRVAGWLHPLAAAGAAQGGPVLGPGHGPVLGPGHGLVLGALPRHGALGALGARGLGARSADLDARSTREGYRFEPGRLYNLEASGVIRRGETIAGAHCDVTRPELAHAVWQAALASSRVPA
ncbi:MAG TPA: hypothetical protein VG276_24015 [Actinomycetes bacterium]|jgi:hypothetical protein|nr:hypothetical protein [Actinomycetes bacterium]